MSQGRIGTRRVRRDGWITVKLWVPADTGTHGPAGLDDDVRRILEMVRLPSPIGGDEALTTFAANMLPVGVDGRWYMSLVRVPFWYAETK